MTPTPAAIPGREQTLDQLAPRMNDARRELVAAIVAGAVIWHRPPTGQAASSCVWDRGPQKAVPGAARPKRMRTVTGEVNWLRSHGLAKLGKDLRPDSTQKAVVLSDRGQQLLDHLAASA